MDRVRTLRYELDSARCKWRGLYDSTVDWDEVYDLVRWMRPDHADTYLAIIAGDYMPSLGSLQLTFPMVNEQNIWVDCAEVGAPAMWPVPVTRITSMKIPKSVLFRYDMPPIQLRRGTLGELLRALNRMAIDRDCFTAQVQSLTPDYVILNTRDWMPPSRPDTPPIEIEWSDRDDPYDSS